MIQRAVTIPARCRQFHWLTDIALHLGIHRRSLPIPYHIHTCRMHIFRDSHKRDHRYSEDMHHHLEDLISVIKLKPSIHQCFIYLYIVSYTSYNITWSTHELKISYIHTQAQSSQYNYRLRIRIDHAQNTVLSKIKFWMCNRPQKFGDFSLYE